MILKGIKITYDEFVRHNNILKDYALHNNMRQGIAHIEDIVLPTDRRSYEKTKVVVTRHDCRARVMINALELIGAIFERKMCVTNPSRLKDWKGWDSVVQKEPVTSIEINEKPAKKATKADFKRSKRQDIIDKNWLSKNGDKSTISDGGIILNHGSRDRIDGDIAPVSRDRCDFGSAFYAGELREQAELLIKDNGTMKIVYKITVDLSGLNTYTFDDRGDGIDIWAIYIAVKRNKIDPQKYPKLNTLVNTIDSNDVIIGLIADNEMTEAFNEFLADSITDKALAYCLSKVNLGHQYAFKSQRACDRTRYADIQCLSKERTAVIKSFHDKIVAGRQGVVESAKENVTEGKRLSQLLKEWK